MKALYIIICLGCLFFTGCQSDENVANNTGYLRLNIGEGQSTDSRIASHYDPKQLAVQIVDANGKVVDSTNDWEDWKDYQLELPAGTYTIQASSNGFDGSESGWDIPYYVGSETVTIEARKEKTANVVCTLANVKVTVNCAPELMTALTSVGVIKVTVGAIDETVCGSLSFAENDTRAAYFPATDLYADVLVVSKTGQRHTLHKELKGVKARDHYQLNLSLAESVTGNGKFSVTVNGETNNIEYNFLVSTKPTTSAAISSNAWSSFAYLEAADLTTASGETIEAGKVKFEYRKQGATDWSSVVAASTEKGYQAKITGLDSETTYDYQLNYNDGEFTTGSTFTTEASLQLPNSGFEAWHTGGVGYWGDSYKNALYPMADATDLFWDSSNPGASVLRQNVTTQATDIKHGGESSARLESKYVVVKFAAASLYAGQFGKINGTDAIIRFGQPFTSRPMSLKGYFQYKPVAIDRYQSGTPDGVVKGDMDKCDIYIALTTKMVEVDSGDKATLNWKDDPEIIAYGELPATMNGSTDGQWKEFNIPLIYRSLTTKPIYIIVVASASKYGDYFTGGAGSTLYLDDFELIYGDDPQTK